MQPFDKLRANGGWGAIFVALLFAALFAFPAAAQTFPKFTGLVVDAANVLPPPTVASLTAKLEKLQQDTKRQLVVVTVPDTGGYPLEDYGYRLGRAWGVGLRDVDNGIVLFIAPGNPAGQRGPRIEVGRGLEPIVTDALASEIANGQMTPMLKAGDVAGAMEAGSDTLIAQLRASPDEARARTDAAIAGFDKTHRRGHAGSGGGTPVLFVFVVMLIAFIALSTLRRGRGGSGQRWGGGVAPVVLWGPGLGGGWGGGGSSGGSGWSSGGESGGSDGSWGGGGFTGGGGGDFGGGGASGGW